MRRGLAIALLALGLALLDACDQSAGLRLADSRIQPGRDQEASEAPPASVRQGWAIGLGSLGSSLATDVVAQSDGTIVVAGQFSRDPERILGTNLSVESPLGIFVAKLDEEGRSLWTVALPGPQTSLWYTVGGIATDRAGNIYVGDAFSGGATFGGRTHTAQGESDLYVAKLAPDGKLLWVTTAGGAGADRVHRIAVDLEDRITITGTFAGTVSFGDTTLSAAGVNDVLVARLTPSGEFVWATRAGGDDDTGARSEYGNALTVDRHGQSYVAARFTTDGTAATYDTFVAKLDAHGRIVWTTTATYTRIEFPTDLALDDGILYVAGQRNMQGILCALHEADGAFEPRCPVATSCGPEAFATSVLAWRRGHVAVAGQLGAPCALGLSTDRGPADAFVARLDSAGAFQRVERGGGPGATCRALGLSSAPNGDLYAVGSYSGSPTLGTTKLRPSATLNGFIWKIPEPER